MGDLFDWLCALEKPGWENGFSLTGAPFIHDTEVIFYPGEKRVQITQTAEGLDMENSLSVKTNIRGQVPYLPASVIAHIAPSKELYQYSDPAVTSMRSRDYSLAFGAIDQTFSCRIQHNIAYQECRRVPRHQRVQARGRTRQLTAVGVFALRWRKSAWIRRDQSNGSRRRGLRPRPSESLL
ncbi:Nidogen-2 [Pteropus alecto]|uniref:Nidogen-2 n=1 Tax=Pteropus alecto TaxID=9402 RepID=L5L1M4_PTEAL|nr:Nidogen-2 [Pteropus alecto]